MSHLSQKLEQLDVTDQRQRILLYYQAIHQSAVAVKARKEAEAAGLSEVEVLRYTITHLIAETQLLREMIHSVQDNIRPHDQIVTSIKPKGTDG